MSISRDHIVAILTANYRKELMEDEDMLEGYLMWGFDGFKNFDEKRLRDWFRNLSDDCYTGWDVNTGQTIGYERQGEFWFLDGHAIANADGSAIETQEDAA